MRTIIFLGPSGPYQVSLHDNESSMEDQSLVVVTNGEASDWTIEVDDSTSGIRRLSGMTRAESGLWFELRLGSAPEMQYWDNQRLVRADKAV